MVKIEHCDACGKEEGYQDHYQPSPNYHPFASSSTARSAAKGSSSRKGSQIESGASIEDDEESALSAAGD